MNPRKDRIHHSLACALEDPRHLRVVRSSTDGFAEASAALDTIVVASDLSNHAANAANRVAMLADEVNLSKVTMLHVLEEPRLVPFRQRPNASRSANARRIEDARRQLVVVADQLRMRTSLTVESQVEVVVHGNAVATLLAKERELNEDLIVLTRRNKSLAEGLLLESVTSSLLERSRCDALVVH